MAGNFHCFSQIAFSFHLSRNSSSSINVSFGRLVFPGVEQMDDNQIAAEILATREVLTNVLHNLANDPLRRATIRRGFDEASDLVSRRQSDLALRD